MLRDPILGFSSFEEWLADPGASETDLVLYSVEQGDEDDMLLDDLRQMVQAATGAKIVVTSNHHDPMIAHEVLAAGARGYIPNSMPDVVWMQALNFVRVGGVFAPPPVAFDAQPPRTDPYQQAAQEAIACGVLSDEPAEAVPNRNGSGDDRHMLNEPRPDARPTICFTPRELEVVKALRDGQSNKIIAYTLDMSESTVKVHIRNVMKKLRARNRTEVAVMVGKMLVDGQLDS